MENTDKKNNVLLNSDEITTYDKGRQLEVEFSEFMKSDLGWQKVRVGAHLPGKSNRKGAAIDVIGYKRDERGDKLYNLGITFLSIAVGLIVFSIFLFVIISNDVSYGFVSILFGLIFLGGALYSHNESNKLQKENAWVECKNLKGKANITQIDKSLREIKDYRASGDKEHKFEYHYFVSSSGYIENALKYALENNIICYEKKDNKFIKTSYWK